MYKNSNNCMFYNLNFKGAFSGHFVKYYKFQIFNLNSGSVESEEGHVMLTMLL